MKDKQPETYESALAKLQSIVRDLENEQTSIDELAEKTKQAATLIEFCRKKLKSVESSLYT